MAARADLGDWVHHALSEERIAELTRLDYGQALTENTTMLRMCEHLGFDIADDPHTKGIKVVTLRLAGAGTGP